MPLDPASLDAALFVQSYHDLYWRPKKGWPATDPAKALAQLVPALKPGGVVVVIDHVANAGDPTETVNAMHRVDPAVLKRDFEAAGLTFDSDSPLFGESGGRSHEGSVRQGAPPASGSGDVQVRKK